jgi:hypothetical protein
MVMTAFVACLFTLAALASAWSISATIRRYGPGATMLRAQFDACPGAMMLEWKSVERVAAPTLAEVKLPEFRRRMTRRTACLEWPQVSAALELAA